jgi:Uma2 family endonuclease
MGFPAWNSPLTIEDLEKLPDNGLRHELLDGHFVMNPPPAVRHNRVVDNLRRQLQACCDAAGFLVLENQGVDLGEDVVVPDLTVYREDAPIERGIYLDGADALLVVEVISPSTRKMDRITKPVKCASHGVPLYLLVDPTVTPLTATLYTLDGLDYDAGVIVRAGEPLALPAPFALTIDTASL